MNNKKRLLSLIAKYQDGLASENDIELLINFFDSFQESKEWPKEIQHKELVIENMLLNIQKGIKKETEIIPISKTKKHTSFKFMKYAAAVVLFISLSYFFTKDNMIIKDTVVTKNDIKVGTNKAILTLENGSNIILEKGKTFKKNNISANGEELVYTNNDNPNSESAPDIIYNYLTIPRGGEFYIKLSDGTKVWLNSETKIKYPVTFIAGKDRKVELLYGEAYFDVSPSTNHNDASFIVENQNQEITVLGTEFNVKAYKNEAVISTTLVEGSVAVQINNEKSLLKPSQQLNYNNENENSEIIVVDTDNETSWRKGYFNFTDKPLYEITPILSRWYDIDIVIENTKIENIKFKGKISRSQNIENILLTLKNTNNISYEITNTQITIN